MVSIILRYDESDVLVDNLLDLIDSNIDNADKNNEFLEKLFSLEEKKHAFLVFLRYLWDTYEDVDALQLYDKVQEQGVTH